jgi:hypothetical protein
MAIYLFSSSFIGNEMYSSRSQKGGRPGIGWQMAVCSLHLKQYLMWANRET